MNDTMILRSILLFLIAGLCEIAGGYLVWLWLRDGRAVWLGMVGGLILFLYGVLPTLQPETASFGRVYAEIEQNDALHPFSGAWMPIVCTL